MRRRSKPNELTVVVLSGSGEQTHSMRLTRKKVAVALTCWLLILLVVAVWGFQSAGPDSAASGSARAGSSASAGAAGSRAGAASRQ
jgi:hypothetical protein